MKKPGKRATEVFEKGRKKAERLAHDAKAASELLDAASKKAAEQAPKLGGIYDDLKTLVRLMKSWVKGDYRKVGLNTILMAFGALLYFVNPFDAIFDYIPGAGYIDDATVMAWVLASLRFEIKDFRVWEKSLKREESET